MHTAITASAQLVTLIGPTNHTWRYLADGSDQGTAWQTTAFNDSAWPEGQGLFGNENNYPYPINTIISGVTPINVYYRAHFNWAGGIFGLTLIGTNYVDDGSIIYLNGVEIARFNMPPGPAAFDTLATAANPGGFPNVNGGEPVLVQLHISPDALTNGNANPLITGDNVIAVEVHNSAAGSDRVFGLSLFAGHVPPCATDNLQPTNRMVLEGRSTTFVVVTTCFTPPTVQWYRNVGLGEELIVGATSTDYTLTNARRGMDEGVYYCRVTSILGTVDSRQAVLTIFSDGPEPPTLLSASVVGPGLHTLRLITDGQLCGDANPAPAGCGSDFKYGFNWQILQADDPSIDLGVVEVTQINPTTYEFTTVEARNPTKAYRITVNPIFGEIGGLAGRLVPPGTFAETYPTLIFAQGMAGYTGTQDAEIHSNATADTPLGTATQMKCDLDDTGIAQGLLHFDNIIGNGANRIPFGSRIVSATLTLYQTDPGSTVNLHRMLVDWNQSTATWNNLVNGVLADDVEARNAPDATKPVGATNGPVDLDVTASVQAWLNGQPNYGWALLSTGTDGWTIITSESGAGIAPMLTVAYEGHIDVCQPGITVQPPATIVATELQSVIIAVGVANTFLPVFQWTRNGVDIPGANQLTYVIPSASPLNAGTYRLRMSCETDPSRAVTSNPCVLTLTGLSRPYLIGAWAEPDGVTVRLRFSRPMNQVSAQNPANYAFIPPVTGLGAVLSNSSVTLTTAPREFATSYRLRISDVTDISAGANVVVPNPTFVNLTSARVIVPWDATDWLYCTNSQNTTLVAPNIPWFAQNFAPGADWRTGRGLFGHETSPSIGANLPAPIATPLVPNDVAAESELRVTTYFRKTISLPALPEGASYVLCHFIDDGAMFYLDGTEIGRVNMTNTPPMLFGQRAAANIEASLQCFTLSAAPGEHTLAAEVHQAGLTTSSDVLFGVEIRATGAVPRLEISHEPTGIVRLDWQADSSWELLGANRLDGSYSAVAGNPLGTIRLPASTQTNHSFYQLRYTGRP